MNRIQRVTSAIHHQPVTPIPRGELVVDREFIEDFFQWQERTEATGKASDTELLIDFCHTLKLDVACVQSGEIKENAGTVSVNLADIRQIRDEGLFVFFIVNGAFQTAMHRQGFMPFLMNIAKASEEVGREMKRVSKQVVTTIKQGVAAGAHGILIADDIAYTQGTYMNPAFGERYLLPLWQEQVAAAHNLKTPVFFHSDGNISSILPLLVAAGFNGLQCIEPAAGMDILEVKTNFGNDLCLMGNIDPLLLSEKPYRDDFDAPYDTLQQVVTGLMASFGGDGGYIFGTCSGLHAGLSPERVHFMYEIASKLN